MFGAQGPIGVEQITTPATTAASMVALDNGRFVLAHLNDFGEDATADTLIVPELDVFEANGTFANIRFPATSEQRIQATWPMLAPLSGGRCLLGWVEFSVDGVPATRNVKARVFTAQGALGQVTQVNTATGGERFSLAVTAMSDPNGESLFAAWNDDSPGGGDPTGRAVRGRPLTVPAGGF
jgi:hypothetical protein